VDDVKWGIRANHCVFTRQGTQSTACGSKTLQFDITCPKDWEMALIHGESRVDKRGFDCRG